MAASANRGDLESRVRATFLLRLRVLRAGRSIADVAESSGLSYSTVSAWFDGRREPGLSGLVALARGLELSSIEEFLGPLPAMPSVGMSADVQVASSDAA